MHKLQFVHLKLVFLFERKFDQGNSSYFKFRWCKNLVLPEKNLMNKLQFLVDFLLNKGIYITYEQYGFFH